MAKAVQSGMKNRARDEDDEDEAPAPKKKARPPVDEDDDEEPAPKKKAKAPVDEDEDADEAPAPKKKSRPVDDDDDDDDDAPKGKGSDDVIDLSSADDNASYTAEVMPKGKYRCTIEETEFVVFKTGSKGMKIRLEVTEGEYAKSKKRKRGKTLFTNIVLSANAADLLKTSLKALGVDKKTYNSPAFSAKMLQRIADSGDLIGNEVIADVSIRAYEGEKQNNVRRLLPPTAMADAATGSGGFMED